MNTKHAKLLITAMLVVSLTFVLLRVISSAVRVIPKGDAVGVVGSTNLGRGDDGAMPTMGSSSKRHRYAYAFVVGGCGPEKRTYRYFLYNILVATQMLRQDGAKADVVAMFQMLAESNATKLPDDEERMLRDMNIKAYYIPKTKEHDTFYSVCLQKFRILGLTQYRRVLFLDADLIPLGNLDYVFDVVETGVLKESLIIPATGSPANAGFFLMTPYEDAMRDIQEIIRKKEERGNDANREPFDPVLGWGHKIVPPDHWEKLGSKKAKNELYASKRGTNWTYFGANADQGLMYHFTKYFRRQVSIMFGSKVQNWAPGPNGAVMLEATIKNPFLGSPSPKYRGLANNCHKFSPGGCHPPMSDFQHFLFGSKPWRNGPPKDLSEATKQNSPRHLWFYTLSLLNKKLDMGLDEQLRSWTKVKSIAPLGPGPTADQARDAHTNLLGPLHPVSE